MSSTPSIKFRPSLSADQISYILSVFEHPETVHTNSTLFNTTIKALRVFDLKARHGIVTPSHVSTGRATLVDSLGFTDSQAGDNISIEALVKIYDVTPQVLTQSQVDRVNLHRYTNDLMSPTEESEYESRT